jgi:beta-glucosidase
VTAPGRLTFPEGFLWGSAGSAHQTEGDNTASDWWAYEHAPDTGAAEPSGIACDSYHRFAEDWRLVASSGQNAVRFSVEWARIEPRPGEVATEELDHYREVIGAARDLGLEPCVTLHHFTNPAWFAAGGGWAAEDAPAAFARYVRVVAGALGDLLTWVGTINEPSVVALLGHYFGVFPPRRRDLGLAHRVTVNLLRAHAAAVRELRAATAARVGLPLSVLEFAPVEASVAARRARDYVHHWWVGVWLDALRTGRLSGLEVPEERVPGLGGDDWVGVQYYTRFPVWPGAEGPARARLPGGGRGARAPSEPLAGRVTQMGWAWHPAGFGAVLDEVAEATGLPILVTENGIATLDDAERIEFVRLHLAELHAAIARRRDVRGYFYWSTLDNFEWNEGYRPRFGLVAVDRRTLERQPKPSLAWYGAVARAGVLEAPAG